MALLTTIAATYENTVRRTLEQQRDALLSDLRHELRETCAGADTVQPEDSRNALDAGAAMSQTDIHVTMMNSKTETLVAIEDALARLNEGLYGRCESCSESIAPARLRVVPFALRCTRCEEAKETAERGRQQSPLQRRLSDRRREFLRSSADSA